MLCESQPILCQEPRWRSLMRAICFRQPLSAHQCCGKFWTSHRPTAHEDLSAPLHQLSRPYSAQNETIVLHMTLRERSSDWTCHEVRPPSLAQNGALGALENMTMLAALERGFIATKDQSAAPSLRPAPGQHRRADGANARR